MASQITAAAVRLPLALLGFISQVHTGSTGFDVSQDRGTPVAPARKNALHERQQHQSEWPPQKAIGHQLGPMGVSNSPS